MVKAYLVIKPGVRLRITRDGETHNTAIPVGVEIPADALSEKKVKALSGKITPVAEPMAPPVVEDTEADNKPPVVDTNASKAPVVPAKPKGK